MADTKLDKTPQQKTQESLNDGHRARIKKRFSKDLGQTMEDYELLEVLLTYAIPRRDVKKLAKELVKKFGSVSAVFGADLEKLQAVKGLGQSSSIFLKVVHKCASVCAKQDVIKGSILNSWDRLMDYLVIEMAHKEKEEAYIIFLDSKNRLISSEVQTKGTVNETKIYPREVVSRALALNACAVILVHNHPSGDPTPSTADIEMTKFISDACLRVNIKLHDHIIVGKEKIMSFKNTGLLM